MTFRSTTGTLAVLALTLLTACSDPYSSDYATGNLAQPEAQRVSEALTTVQGAHDLLAGTTGLSISSGYGSQIEYLAPNGQSQLWFHDQVATTPGRWKVVGSDHGPMTMCFRYGENSYDPVLRDFGGAWECGPLPMYLDHLASLGQGDPFHLASGRAPAITSNRSYTMEALQQLSGSRVSQRPITYVFNRLSGR